MQVDFEMCCQMGVYPAGIVHARDTDPAAEPKAEPFYDSISLPFQVLPRVVPVSSYWLATLGRPSTVRVS